MSIHPETKRLKQAQSAINKLKFEFGPNKQQELTRLIYEISKRDSIACDVLLNEATKESNLQSAKHAFISLKNYLLKLRFPKTYSSDGIAKFYLPKVSLNNRDIVKRKKPEEFYPSRIFIEKDAKDYMLTNDILYRFPKARRISIESIKNVGNYNKSISAISGYNKRTKSLFLVKEKFDFIKPCPCSKRVLGCGYYVLNLGFGCRYECSYCFLQTYANTSGIVLPMNIDDYLKKLDGFLDDKRIPIRIGTGEFSDSLALDSLTGYAKRLIEYFSNRNATLELKTKSNSVYHLLSLDHKGKTVISWSVNPQEHIDSDEWLTTSLEDRLEAAKACINAGYQVGFHFDPIIYSRNWQELYQRLVYDVFNKIDASRIAWISLGTFRFSTGLKKVIEQRFPQSKILDQELLVGFDDKLRYHYKARLDIYTKMHTWIRSYSKSALVYLCMEPREAWKEVLGKEKFCDQ